MAKSLIIRSRYDVEAPRAPVVAAVAAGLTAVGVGAATAALVAEVIVAIAGAALSFGLQKLLAASQGRPQQEQLRRELARETSIPFKRFVYGETIAAGSPAPWKVKGNLLYGCMILNSRPSDGANPEFFLDKRRVEIDSEAKLLDFESEGAIATNDPFANLARFWLGLGDQTTAPKRITDAVPEIFIPTDAWQGLTVLWLELDAGPNSSRPERWPTVPPFVEVKARWSKVWDPRRASQSLENQESWAWSNNQALCALDAHTQNPRQPYQLRDLIIPMWRDAAIQADVFIPTKTGDPEPAYRADGTILFQEEQELAETIEPLVSAGAASLVTVGGQVGIIPGTYEAPEYRITDLIGDSFQFTGLAPVREIANQVHTTYLSSDRRFETAELPVFSVPGSIEDDGGPPSVSRFNLEMVHSPTQAARIQKIFGYRLRQQKSLSCVAPPSALDLIAGTVVEVDLPAPYEKMNGQYWVDVCTPTAIPDDGVALSVSLSLIEIFPEAFAWDPEVDEPSIPEFTEVSADINPTSPPTDFVVTSEALPTGSSATLVQARLTWSPSSTPSVSIYETQHREVGEDYQGGPTVLAETLNSAGKHVTEIGPLEIGATYDFRVRALGDAGASAYVEVTDLRVSERANRPRRYWLGQQRDALLFSTDGRQRQCGGAVFVSGERDNSESGWRMTIYTWPPVSLASRPLWTVRDPVQTSRSLLSGRRFASRHGRRRIYAEFSVSARKRDMGAGYMEALKDLLQGGSNNFVRLSYRRPSPINRQPKELIWTSGGTEFCWQLTAIEDVLWTGAILLDGLPIVDGGFPALRVTGQEPGSLVCGAGEFIRIGTEYRTCIAEAYAQFDGIARIRLNEAFTVGGPAELGAAETGIFEVVSFPETGGPLGSDYTYDWSFSQVYEDEIDSQTEANPWGS